MKRSRWPDHVLLLSSCQLVSRVYRWYIGLPATTRFLCFYFESNKGWSANLIFLYWLDRDAHSNHWSTDWVEYERGSSWCLIKRKKIEFPRGHYSTLLAPPISSRSNSSPCVSILGSRDMISISISVHVRPAIWMKCIPVRGRNQAKRYFQALLNEFPTLSHRSVKEWANKHPAKAQLAHGRWHQSHSWLGALSSIHHKG